LIGGRESLSFRQTTQSTRGSLGQCGDVGDHHIICTNPRRFSIIVVSSA
jgi:hypothetical protein